MTILLDPPRPQRADGLSVNFVTGPDGSGFIVDNPNQPPGVRQLSALELKTMIESGRPFELVDVHTEEERAIAKIEALTPSRRGWSPLPARPRSQHDRRVSVPPRHPQPVRRRVLSA
jgi:hypothetical protein